MESRRYNAERKIITGYILSIAVVFLVMRGFLFPGEPSSLSVSQAYTDSPRLIAYVDILDSTGSTVTGLGKDQFVVTVGQHQATVNSVTPFVDYGEGAAYIVLVDISKTLTTTEFKQIQAALVPWIDKMKPADRMTILAFGQSCSEKIDFSGDKEKLKEVIMGLAPSDMETKLYDALDMAMKKATRRDVNLPGRRVIVILTDGKDEGSGLTESDIKNAIEANHIPIYAIGYSSLDRAERDRYLNILKNLSALSGGVYIESSPGKLEEMYQLIQQSILRVYRLEIQCSQCQADGQRHRLQVYLVFGDRRLTDGLDILLIPPVTLPPVQPQANTTPPRVTTPVKESKGKIPTWVYAAAVGGLILIVVVFLVLRRKKTPLAVAAETLVEEVITPAPVQPIIPSAPVMGIEARLVEVGSRGKSRDYRFNLQDKAIVGRQPGCDVVIEDDMDISRRHFQLLTENHYVVIEDLGTTNGTLVNGVPITGRFRLSSGDKIIAGRTELRIIFE